VAEAQKVAIRIAAEEGAKAADVVAKLEAQKAEQAAYRAALLADEQEQKVLEVKMHEVAQQEDAQALKDVRAQFEQFKAQLQERFQIVEEATRQIEDYLVPVEDQGGNALAQAEADDAREAAAQQGSPSFKAKRAAQAARAAIASTRRLMDQLPQFPDLPASAASVGSSGSSGSKHQRRRLRGGDSSSDSEGSSSRPALAETAEGRRSGSASAASQNLPAWLQQGQYRAPRYTDESE
jgi:hypothetical protein